MATMQYASHDLGAKAKEGVVGADLVGMRFNTIGVSDGISMGTRGMSFSCNRAISLPIPLKPLWVVNGMTV